MKITREKHMAHLVRLMPILLLAVGVQYYFYTWWAPTQIVVDVTIFMTIGLGLIALGFAFYDHFHTVQLHRHYLAVTFSPIQYHEEILYRNIEGVDVETTKHSYHNVTLYLRDGSTCKLWYLDEIETLMDRVQPFYEEGELLTQQ